MFRLIVDAHHRRAIYWHPHLDSPLLVNFQVLYCLFVVKQTMDVRDKICLLFCRMDTNTKGEVALFGINATRSRCIILGRIVGQELCGQHRCLVFLAINDDGVFL